MKVSLSILESFRQLRDDDHFYDSELMPEQKLLSYIKKTAPEAENAKLVKAFYEILQNPNDCYDRFSRYYKASGFRASNNVDFPFDLITECLKNINSKACKDVKMEKTYLINGQPITVTTNVHALYGAKVDNYKLALGSISKTREGDIKRASQFNYDKYHKSLAHKFYLDICEAEIFEYNVFDILINKLNEGNFELEEIHKFQFYKENSNEAYISELLNDFLAYIKSRNLEGYFEQTTSKEIKPKLNGVLPKQEKYTLDEAMDDLLGEKDIVLDLTNNHHKNNGAIKMEELDFEVPQFEETLPDFFNANVEFNPVITEEKIEEKVVEEPKAAIKEKSSDKGNKIYHLEIKNFVGIEELKLTPDSGVIIRAKNGTGKTSVIKALKSALGGGSHDAKLIRLGSEEAQIGLELENGIKIKKTITHEKQTLSVTQNGKKVTKAQTILNELFDEFGTNPLDLLTAPAKLRVEILLDAIKLRLTEAEIQQALNGAKVELFYNLEEHALNVIDDIKKQINEERKGTKQILDIKQKSYDNSTVHLLEVPGNPDELIKTIENLEKEKTELETKKANAIEDINKRKEEAIEKIKAQADLQKDNLESQFQKLFIPKIEELTQAKIAHQNLAVLIAQKEQLKEDKKEIDELTLVVASRTKLLDNFENLKDEVKKRLPIPGLEIINNEIFKDGIAFEHLNTAEQMKLCIKIGSLHNNSGLMLIDGVERLDKVNQDLLLQLAKENGLQLIVTEVSEDTKLNIEKLGA